MANYTVDPSLLKEYLPKQTELDYWNGSCYVSLVGFMFLNTSVKNIKFPFHINFEEVNLRFYVKYKSNDIWKRGVVFVKEIVPKRTLTFIANTVYKENYETLPMKHRWESSGDNLFVQYQWRKYDKWNSISVNTNPNLLDIEEGSEEEFITEHFWGYTRINDNCTSEYEVQHPRWQVYHVKDYQIDVGFDVIYGDKFGFLQDQEPLSVFLAEGSEISVKHGRRFK